MKWYIGVVALVTGCCARDPFFLACQVHPSVLEFKGTAIGEQATAYIEYNGQTQVVEVGDMVGDGEVAEIGCGFLCLKYKNGTKQELHLAEEGKVGE